MKKLLCGFLLLVSALAHSTLAGAASVVLGQAGAGGVSVIISPDPEELGRPANIWMGAVLNGTLYLRNGPTNWAEYRGGPLPIALTSAVLPSSLQVSIANFDISSLPGLDVYVGYGSTEPDLSRSGHLAKVYTTVLAQAAPETGWWWNPNQSGRGFSIEILGTTLFMAGYLYENDGRATWLVSGGPMQDATTYVGRLSAFSNGQTLTGDYQAPVPPTDAGAVTLQFTDDSHGTLTWPGGTIPIERFRFSNAAAASFQPENGWWWNEAESGRWFFTEIQGDQVFMAGYMYDANGNPVWYVSRGAMDSPTTYQGDWYQYANGQTLTGPYKPPSAPTNVGTVRLEFSAPDQATLTLSDNQQPTAALFPASKSVNGASRVKIINIERQKKVPLLTRPDLWKGTFSYTYTLIPDGGVVTYSKLNVTGTVTWVEDELTPLGGSTKYIILEGQAEATLDEKITTTTGACPGKATVTGKGTKELSPSEGQLTLENDNSYTGRLFFEVPMKLTFVDPCGTSSPRSRDIFHYMFLSGNMVYLNMYRDVPDDGSFPGVTITKSWNFKAVQRP